MAGKLRDVTHAAAIVAIFISLLMVGITLSIFNMLSALRVNINGTTVALLPPAVNQAAQTMGNTFAPVLLAVGVMVIVLPVVFLLWVSARGGR